MCSNKILLHSDISKIGYVSKSLSKKDTIEDVQKALFNALGKKVAYLPTFNYRFLSEGKYSYLRDKSEVGVFSEHIRKMFPYQRTFDPVFSFVATDCVQKPPKKINFDAFGPGSLFHKLLDDHATIIFLGAEFSTATFIHCIEQHMNVPYRYKKTFKGVVHYDESPEKSYISLNYFVRPRNRELVQYDFKKLLEDLFRVGIVVKMRLGKAFTYICNMRDMWSFISGQIESNPYYLLTVDSASKFRLKYPIGYFDNDF